MGELVAGRLEFVGHDSLAPDQEQVDQLGAVDELDRRNRGGQQRRSLDDVAERGSKIADELIKKGYVELTDTVAREYGRALSSATGRTVTAKDLFQSTVEVDYARNQLQPLLRRPEEGSQ